MNKYRSTINPLTLIVNIILYLALLYLSYIKTPNFFLFILIIVLICLGFSLYNFLRYKYYLESTGLLIKHKRERVFINYKDIKYVEVNSETRGIIYGYGVKRLLVCCGKHTEDSYLITPANEEEFIKNLEIKVKNAKKDTNYN